MANEEKIVRKIPVEILLDVLTELYNRGVNFIDISGSGGTGVDEINITFGKAYMDEEYQEDFENLIEEDLSEDKIKVNEEVTDEDIDRIL